MLHEHLPAAHLNCPSSSLLQYRLLARYLIIYPETVFYLYLLTEEKDLRDGCNWIHSAWSFYLVLEKDIK
jgi:hypothetical protein